MRFVFEPSSAAIVTAPAVRGNVRPASQEVAGSTVAPGGLPGNGNPKTDGSPAWTARNALRARVPGPRLRDQGALHPVRLEWGATAAN